MPAGSNTTSARLEHVDQLAAYRVPRTNFEIALMAVANVPRRLARDGRRSAMVAALGNKATWGQIKHWRAGRRRVPDWAIAELDSKLAARQAIDNGARSALASQ